MGARIFPDGRNPKDRSSLALQRRVPRGMRRRRDRYLLRRDDFMEALAACGLMPGPDNEDERRALQGLDPYIFRRKALDHPLSPHELGRALFHLSQRRGFKSNRKAGGEDDTEAKKTRADINELRRRIRESGARTLGEFLARRHSNGRTVRARAGTGLYPDRAMYQAEFDAIRAAQEPHQALRPEQWDTLRDIMFRQRPLRPVEPGWCLLEPGEKRAARGLPVAQEFRMVQEVNNLRVRTGLGTEMRPLTAAERAALLDKLRSQKEVKFEAIVKLLGLPQGTQVNMDQWNRKGLKGDETSALLSNKNLFDKRWRTLSFEERMSIAHVLIENDDPEAVRLMALNEWGLSESAAARVADLSLPDGHAHLGEKAIRNLLPLMEEQGLLYSEAVAAHPDYSHHSDFRPDAGLDDLPYYGQVLPQQVVGADPENAPLKDEPAYFGRIANPTVHIGLNQVRRVVNRLIEVRGKPQHIVVELARDLKMNRDQRAEAQRAQREGGERNDRLRKDLEAAEQPVTGEALRKLRIWEEQGPPQARFCPYTGEIITFEMAVSAATDIDHILPISKTLDDSPANQVVCLARANRDKGGRSPYDAFGHSPPGYNYEKIMERAEVIGDTLKGQGKRDSKSWRFMPDAMERFSDEHGFLDRQLNETKHLSRVARTYLAHLFDEKSAQRRFVDATPGRLTAAIRRGWGLNSLLFEARKQDGDAPDAKLRDDHRHHAIDAFVVACTTPKMVQDMMRAASLDNRDEAERSENLAQIAAAALPWDGFTRDDLRPFIERMVVSHRPDHGTRGVRGKTTGQLHNDTAYGIVDQGNGKAPAKVVVRKPLSNFSTRKHVEAVRDPALRVALLALWDRVALDGGKPVVFARKAEYEGVNLSGRVQRVRSVRVLETINALVPITDQSGKPYKAYQPASNEFVDIWRMPNGKWQLVTVTAFDANQLAFDPISSRPHPAAKRLMRLQIDDMAAIGNGKSRRVVRVRKITAARSGVFVVLDSHNEANVANRVNDRNDPMQETRYTAARLMKEGFRKVGVDEIGRILDPGPRR